MSLEGPREVALISKAGPERDSRERVGRLGQHPTRDLDAPTPDEFAQRAAHGLVEGPSEVPRVNSNAFGDLGESYATPILTASQRDGFS